MDCARKKLQQQGSYGVIKIVSVSDRGRGRHPDEQTGLRCRSSARYAFHASHSPNNPYGM